MMPPLPRHYFRIRENGAAVFRIDTENRQRRLELEEIAVVNIRNGNIKPHGDQQLTPEDRAAIDAWMATRRDELAAREAAEVQRLIEQLNLVSHWAAGRADPEALEVATEPLLLAMHDLRSVLVRAKAERLATEPRAPSAG